jgi:adenylate cyclase
MEFRIGVNLGDVIVDGEQIYGDGINVAARMESLAEPGGICISRTVHENVRNKLPLNFADLGEQAVKNIAEAVHVWRLLLDGTVTAPRRKRRIKRSYWQGGVLSLAGLAIIAATIVLVQRLSLKPPRTSASIPPQEKPVLPLPEMPSVAVLPFTNLSGDSSQEYFSDGLTDLLITRISRLPGVFVIARNSTFFYKGKAKTAQQVGRELGVRTILEGSVLKAGNRVRINAQLADATNGANLWAQSFDQPLKDIFTVQEDIVRDLVTTLSGLFKLDNLKILRSTTFLEDRQTDNIEAFDDALQASEGFWRQTKEGNEKARQMCQRAIRLDPNYAEAYAGLGWTYWQDLYFGRSTNAKADLERASELAQKALSIDDSNVLALALVSFNDWMQQRFDQAVVDAKRIIAVNPNFTIGYESLAVALIADGKPEEAIPTVQKAIRLDPASPDFYLSTLGGAYLDMGRYQQAAAILERRLGSYPNDLDAHVALAVAYTELGRDQDARAQVAEVMRLNPQYTLPPLEKF